jgi:hypothetical protein
MYVKLSWRAEVYENWAIMVVQPPILTYPAMVFKTIYLCFHPLPIPMVARITKYLNKYVRRGICLIYMSSFYFWSENWAIMAVQPPILTYPTMAFYFWLAPQVPWNDLRGIVIKQKHWKTFWGIIHVDQATLSRIAWHTCIIPQNVYTCLCFINIYSKTVYTLLDWNK